MVSITGAFLRTMEWVAALSLCLAMIIVTASAIGRYLLAFPIPDAFDISRLMIGAAIAWGLAAAELRNTHIRIEIFAGPPRSLVGKAIAVFAWGVGLVFAAAVCWTMWGKVAGAMKHVTVTSDLRLPLWPFYSLVWGGIAAAVIAFLLRRFYVPARDVKGHTS